MFILEIVVAAVGVYVLLLLLLEAVIWKVQPSMDNGVTLHVNRGGSRFTRKLYGFEYGDKLYVSSNHWFRRWYHAILDNPQIDVEQSGEKNPFLAVPIDGEERAEVNREYKMGFILRMMCGFAPRRFLRLDPLAARDDA